MMKKMRYYIRPQVEVLPFVSATTLCTSEGGSGFGGGSGDDPWEFGRVPQYEPEL